MLRLDKQQISAVRKFSSSRYVAQRSKNTPTHITTHSADDSIRSTQDDIQLDGHLDEIPASWRIGQHGSADGLLHGLSPHQLHCNRRNKQWIRHGPKSKSINNYLCVIKIRSRQCTQSPSGDIGIHHHMNKGNSSFLGMGVFGTRSETLAAWCTQLTNGASWTERLNAFIHFRKPKA